ncbi:MAG: hypothetical protein IPJ98_00110 [Bryobacterales bacterium]|nr:hypothetical protein [Bryobacterales bacterium]
MKRQVVRLRRLRRLETRWERSLSEVWAGLGLLAHRTTFPGPKTCLLASTSGANLLQPAEAGSAARFATLAAHLSPAQAARLLGLTRNALRYRLDHTWA